jgi:ferrous iron transport protein B
LQVEAAAKNFDVKVNAYAVALVGSPNSGKTTLFNWLTGSKFKTVNYPGATVEYSLGSSHERYGEQISIMDTPGTYSLVPKSPDEVIAVQSIFAHKNLGQCPLVISVIDSTHFVRHMLITQQLIKSGFNIIVALTMTDLIRARGEKIDVALLSKTLGVPVVEIDGQLGGGVSELLEVARKRIAEIKELKIQTLQWSNLETEKTLQEATRLSEKVFVKSPGQKFKDAKAETARLDQILLHPVFGLIIFFLMMSTLFTSIFWLAKPLMNFISDGFAFAGEKVLAQAPHSLWASFISDGLLASIGSVLTFVPQIFILFVGIIAFEDSGYLARAATLIDKPFSKIGLNGRSFVPILSAYACAVPAMMAARTINSKRERWITLFIIPLLSCSARLPVYSLLLSFLFQKEAAYKAGLALTAIYFASLGVSVIVASIVNKFLKMQGESLFMLELPIYRMPKLRNIFHSATSRTYSYLRRAGPAIFTFALIMWVTTSFPRYDLENKVDRLSQSYAARVGRSIEPVFTPLGGDWRTGVALITAFAAREVFVSSLAVVLGVTDDAKASQQENLLKKMGDARAASGKLLFTPASVLGLMIFFMIALQCLSTSSMATREEGLKFAIFQLVIFNVVAYILAVILVQSLHFVGIA